tara:strand:+ start:110 stop:586 length:477 start_codon:yes stop_codon:yes gene_type:complete
MGRHYDGDISGKFWFGIQSSDDAIHFGAEPLEPEPAYDRTQSEDDDGNIIYEEEEIDHGYIDYHISFANIDDTLDGIQECKRELGDELLRFTEFFNAHPDGYNEEMIAKYYKKHFNKIIDDEFIRWFLTIYARLGLGMQILVYFNENPGKDCNFTAEM